MPSTLPLSGRLVTTIIGCICRKPIKGDDTWPEHSIGVATDSIVATDGNSAILVGKPADLHVATLRKEAAIEAFRANQYGEPVNFDEIPRNVSNDGESQPMPMVQKVIRENLATMQEIGSVTPDALVNVGKVAMAAGASVVRLMQPKGDPTMLGFEFTFAPDTEHVNLFSEWEGTIKAAGVFQTARSFKETEDLDGEGGEEPEILEIEVKPARKRPAKPAPIDALSSEETGPSEPQPAAPPELVDPSDSEQVGVYRLPPVRLLRTVDGVPVATDHTRTISDVFRSVNVTTRPVSRTVGPSVTLYRYEVPPGTSVKKISPLGPDISAQTGVASVRVLAPIPGERAIGIEVANEGRATVSLRQIVELKAFAEAPRLTFAVGLELDGTPRFADLTAMPHLLIGGATNAGKSIGLASLITSLLLRHSPRDLRFVMIDPKRVELTLFDRIPHLMCPVIKDTKEAAGVLRAVLREMDRRYDLFSESGVRNIEGWNARDSAFQDKLPYIVVVIDELADLMYTAGKEVETVIVRLAQMARAVGIHLVVATQRPSVDVVTGLIKANIPSRIAYAVASGTDSRVILDSVGAEDLLGKGDMLFSPIGSVTKRLQGAYVSEEEVAAVCRYWRDQEPPAYLINLDEESEESRIEEGPDGLLADAALFTVEKGQMSTSMLQRKFSIGFQRASRLIEALESRGILGPRNGATPGTALTADVEEALRRAK